MGTTVELRNTNEDIYADGNDSIVIRRYLGGITGGRSLDMTDFPDEYVKGGHIVIRETASDVFKPMPVSDGAYSMLPSGCEYVGVVVRTKPANKAMVGIMNNGEVNDQALPYPLTDEMRAALKIAIPTLIFTHD